jgi:hypothetical protein
MPCPLCLQDDLQPFHRDAARDYLRCPNCLLVSVPACYHLTNDEEEAVYRLHENDVHDPGYRKFLSRLTHPLIEHLAANAHGLDFGSGPGPALATMLREEGFEMSIYDPFFAPQAEALDRPYDFITLTEVAEHLAAPAAVFKQLSGMLRIGGWLGIITQQVIDLDSFQRWRYIQDPTHISFFCPETFAWIAAEFGYAMKVAGRDTILLQKS